MTSTQDCSIGVATEAAYGTNTTVTRWYEFLDENFDFRKNVKQGGGLRVGARSPRSGRRVVTSADAGGDLTLECASKGMGLLWQACLGSGTSTLVSGSTFQQVFTYGDNPTSLTVQKGLVQAGLTVDAYTYIGCMVDSWELSMPNGDIPTLKMTFDCKDFTSATSYAAPSYPSAVNLFHFANWTIASGTLTAPTSTALAAGTTNITDVRSASVKLDSNPQTGRYNGGGAGRKSKPTMGERVPTGTLEVEYDNTTFRDAAVNETPMCLIFTYTGGALSTGNETLQIVLPEVKIDNPSNPNSNGNDLITTTYNFSVLDNLTAAQPLWVVTRTADTTL